MEGEDLALADLLRFAGEGDVTTVEDVDVRREVERSADVLLDKEQRGA